MSDAERIKLEVWTTRYPQTCSLIDAERGSLFFKFQNLRSEPEESPTEVPRQQGTQQ